MHKLITDKTPHVFNRGEHVDDRSWKRKNGVKTQSPQVHVISASDCVKFPIMRRVIREITLRHAEKCRRTTCNAR
jgi:hypothetical protein